MTDKKTEYELHIDAYTPETMPMARLAEYMADLAMLLGHKEYVHLADIKPGSTKLAVKIDNEAVPKVTERIKTVEEGEAPDDAMKAFKQLNKKLASDNAIGRLTYAQEGKDTAKVILFPGRDTPKPLDYGKVKQQGTLEGHLIRLGGKDETIPVWLQEGEHTHTGCYVIGADKARQLREHLYAPYPIRVYGEGVWYRDDEGEWMMEKFKIENFEPLDGKTLSEVVEELQNIEGAGWKKMADPFQELQKLRDDPDDEIH